MAQRLAALGLLLAASLALAQPAAWRGPARPEGPAVVTTTGVVTTTTLPATTFTDSAVWDTWVGGPGKIGSTYLNPVNSPDTLYISDGPNWVNIVWSTVKPGDRIQVKSPDGLTLYQDWTVITAYVVVAPGGHADVTGGGPLLPPATGAPVQVILTPVANALPATVGADTNCATKTPPLPDQTGPNGWNGYIVFGKTCATGSNATGYDVKGIAAFLDSAGLNTHLKCSVYTNATPNVHVAGCDSAEVTLAQNPRAYVPLTIPGACHLAASTRYAIACATDSNLTMYKQVSTACPTCWTYAGSLPYAGLWPASVTTSGSYNLTLAVYLTATPSP